MASDVAQTVTPRKDYQELAAVSIGPTVSLDTPPCILSNERVPRPAITFSSSTTSNLILLETINSGRSLSLDSLCGSSRPPKLSGNPTVDEDHLNDDIDEDPFYYDTILARHSLRITVAAVNHSSLSAAEIGPSFEEAIKSLEPLRTVEVKEGISFKQLLNKLGKNLAVKFPSGYFHRSSSKLIQELEELSHVIKTLDIPIATTSIPIPSIVITEDPLAQKVSLMQKEEALGSVSGLGIWLDTGDDKRSGLSAKKSLGTAKSCPSFLEPGRSLRCRFQDVLSSVQKSLPNTEGLLQPLRSAVHLPSPVSWSPNSPSFHPGLSRSHWEPVQYIRKQESKSVPTSPTASFFAASGVFVRKSLDVVTPRPRLPTY